jgi:hypothetical protein
VIAELHEVERLRRQLASADHDLIGAVAERSLPARVSVASTQVFLQCALRLSPGEAASRVRTAELVGERRTVSGEPLEPLLPVVAKVQAAGEISVEHVAVIARVVRAMPDDVTVEALSIAEQQLVDVALQARPSEVAKLGQHVLAWLDPDGAGEREAVQAKRRDLALIPRPDGMSVLRGVLTPECAALLSAVLTARSAPSPADDGQRDPRSHGQRMHDALEDLAGTVVRRNELTVSGAPVTVVITITEDQYLSGHGVVHTSLGQSLTVDQALRLADEAVLVGLLQKASGEVVKLGRAKRVASRSQSLALIARDQGCSFPGCDKPPEMCQRHHVIPWSQGGLTDLDNLTLVCHRHHREFESAGWQCTMRNGVPEWTPPPWIDPTRTPRTNQYVRRS